MSRDRFRPRDFKTRIYNGVPTAWSKGRSHGEKIRKDLGGQSPEAETLLAFCRLLKVPRIFVRRVMGRFNSHQVL